MSNKYIIKYALANALWTAMYIFLVAIILNSGQSFLGKMPDNVLMPVAMLILFVISATITGGLILGRPLLWYLDGQKKESLKLLGYSLITLFGVLVLVLLALFIIR